jgi:hypothetical protein
VVQSKRVTRAPAVAVPPATLTTPFATEANELDRDTRSEHLAALITGAYREMPGLLLTVAQVARMFSCPTHVCRQVMDELVVRGHLRRLPDGTFGKA